MKQQKLDNYQTPYIQHSIGQNLLTDKKYNVNEFWDIIDDECEELFKKVCSMVGIETTNSFAYIDEATEIRELIVKLFKERYGFDLPTINEEM